MANLTQSKKLDVCLIVKKHKKHNLKVINFLRRNKKIKLEVFIAKINSKINNRIKKKKYDFIISYLSPWINRI